MTQSSQSRGGIRIKSYHSPFLYILITLILLTILCFTILSIRLSLTNAVEEDTGKATLTNVAITQAGTGQSVTIDGTTMDETTYGSNTTRRTILNNNVVRYSANYQVATPGTITLSITLPANNTIDEATIGTAQGCLAGSKLEQVATNGKQSYTNNKATCIMNATSTGQLAWGITAYLWGGNNEQIQPTLSTSGIDQSTKPEPIAVVGKANYGISFTGLADRGFSSGYNRTIHPQISLYVKGTEGGNLSALLGVAPLDEESLSIDFDTNNLLPDYRIRDLWGGIDNQNMSMGTSAPVAEKAENGSSAKFSWSYVTTATRRCVRRTNHVDDPCFYAGFYTIFELPVSSLSSGNSQYAMRIQSIDATSCGEPVNITANTNSYIWTIRNRNFGNPHIAGKGNTANVAWDNWWTDSKPVYVGENVKLATWIQLNTVPASIDNVSNNLNFCTTWNPAQGAMNTPAKKVEPSDEAASSILSDYSIQYGIIGTDMSILPSSSQQYCGKVGDENIPGQMMFFNTLDEANQYAKEHNLKVNAMRLWSAKTRANLRDTLQLYFDLVPVSASTPSNVTLNASATTNEWDKRENGASSDTPSTRTYNLTPGLLSHTITAVPSSNAPNTTEHITITPKTYNKDTNAQITTTLPKGLTYQANSFKVANHQLTQGLDYIITKDSSNGSTKITFNLDQIATIPGLENITGESPVMPGEPGNTTDLPIAKDNNGNGITRDSIEFDVLVDSDVPTPSTLTITSQTSGTGTNYASSSFRSASTNITISQARIFGYNLTSSASSLNVNEDLTYTYSNYNLTDNDITNLDTISVLPYNNDAKGETSSHGLTSYNIANLAISANNSNLPLPTLYYTTSPLVRELEQTNPTELATNSSITWTKCTLDSQGKCTNLPNAPTSAEGSGSEASNGGVTAIRWQLPNFAQAAQYYVSLTINNLDAEPQANLVNDITYVAADGITPATHQLPTTTSYIGESLELRLDTTNLTTTMEPNSATSMTNQLTILANTRHGYNLTIQMVGDSNSLIGKSTNQAIPAINTQPTKGTLGWSISTNNTTWQAVPPATSLGLLLHSDTQSGQTTTTLPITYSFSTTQSTLADTYQGQIVYTLVGE